jgi:hypothetical protein
LSKEALSHAEKAVELIPDSERFDWAAARIALANCLHDCGLRTGSGEDLDRAANLIETTVPTLTDQELVVRAHANNTLGTIFLARARNQDASGSGDVKRALKAFEAAIIDSESSFAVDVWSAAKGNAGECLSRLAAEPEIDPIHSSFLKIRSIASYVSATEAFVENAITLQIAHLHLGLAKALLSYAKDLSDPLSEPYLFRSLRSLNIAALTFDKERHPEINAWISYTAASIFDHHAETDGATTVENDLLQAKGLFKEALEFYTQERSPEFFVHISYKLSDIDDRLGLSSKDRV